MFISGVKGRHRADGLGAVHGETSAVQSLVRDLDAGLLRAADQRHQRPLRLHRHPPSSGEPPGPNEVVDEGAAVAAVGRRPASLQLHQQRPDATESVEADGGEDAG